MIRKSAYLQVTRECNNECIFCSNPQFSKEYSFDEAKSAVIGFKKEGINELILTGGEPTEVNFLPELVDFIKANNMSVKVVSNSVNFCKGDLVESLYKSGLRSVYLSVHSVDEKTAERLSQKKGNLKKSLKGIENLIKCGIKINLNSTINSLNCNHLYKNAEFFIKKFPQINHFVYNNLDPGTADGYTKTRAAENPWIVARFVDYELELQRTANLLKKNNKTFRIERVPLCYMNGFEEFSTETRKIVKSEQYICSFITKQKQNEIRRVRPKEMRAKVECCNFCKLNPICAGIQKEYLNINGDREFYPVFKNPLTIIKKIKIHQT